MDGRRSAELVLHGASILSYAMLCALLTVLGPNPLAMVLLPVVTGYAIARGRWILAILLVLSTMGATGAAAVLFSTVEDVQWALRPASGAVVIWFTAAAVSGVPLGLGLVHAWSWRRTYGAMLAILAGATGLFIAWFWRGWLESSERVHTMFEASLVRGRLGQDMSPAQVELARQQMEALLVRHWADISLGLMFAMCAICGAAALTGVNLWYRWRTGRPGLVHGWLETRLPDGLVWLVIGAAALWFANEYWPHDLVRMAGWNLAIGLTAVYWLAGMAVILYMLRAIGAHPAFIAAVVMLIFFLQLHLAAAAIGLFDTWAGFRDRTDRAIEARKKRAESGDDEW